MDKKRVLVWETLSAVSGGQKMTLAVMDLLGDRFDFLCLIPAEGMLSAELKKRKLPYVCIGDQTLPTGVKGKSVVFRYGWMSVRSILRSLKQIRRFQPDILYAPGPAALPWSAVCGALTGKSVIWHLHHVFLDGATKKLLNFCGKWKAVRKIVAVSRCVGAQITHETVKKKVDVLYNPVDFEKYAGGTAASVEKELEPLLRGKPAVLGHVALIQRSKRQDFVLNTAAALRAEGREVVCLFAGECREQAYLEELYGQVKALGMEDRVRFLGRRADVPDLLQVMDVLMIPSSFEGFPLAGLEAASAGVPVAACDAAGAAEFVQVSGNGRTFRENDVASAAAAVAELLDGSGEMIRSGKAFAAQMTAAAYGTRMGDLFAEQG